MSDLPESPMILLSFVNTELRDCYHSLDAFCKNHGADRKTVEDKLRSIDYRYDARLNRFC